MVVVVALLSRVRAVRKGEKATLEQRQEDVRPQGNPREESSGQREQQMQRRRGGMGACSVRAKPREAAVAAVEWEAMSRERAGRITEGLTDHHRNHPGCVSVAFRL